MTHAAVRFLAQNVRPSKLYIAHVHSMSAGNNWRPRACHERGCMCCCITSSKASGCVARAKARLGGRKRLGEELAGNCGFPQGVLRRKGWSGNCGFPQVRPWAKSPWGNCVLPGTGPVGEEFVRKLRVSRRLPDWRPGARPRAGRTPGARPRAHECNVLRAKRGRKAC